jgi:hypothetical protein
MTRTRLVILTLCLCAAAGSSLLADVRTEEKTQTKFEGAMGRVLNFFGGKAAKEGIRTTVAVRGDRKARFGDTDGTIVDLKEEKVYTLDLKKKSYTIVTFAEMRQRMEEARKKAEEDVRKAQAEEAKTSKEEPAPDPQATQVEIDFDVKETGQTKAINGFDTKEVVMTITMREKGKTLEQSGGLVMTSDLWLTPSIAAMKEIVEFDVRYMKQLAGPETFGASVEQMQTAIAAHPMLKDGLSRMAEESRKMDGTAILTVTTMASVKSAEQMAAAPPPSPKTEESSHSAPPTGIGGLIGGFGKRMAQKKAEGGKPEASKPEGPQARATFMTITNERLSVATSVAANDVAIPAGFKEDK